MRIDARMPECGGHPLDQQIGHGVLEPVGLVVNVVDAVAQKLHEIGFDDPVPPQQRQKMLDRIASNLSSLEVSLIHLPSGGIDVDR